jgi:putative addiction module CopG family antidote
MTVEIPLEYQAFVKTVIESGEFQSEEQVVGESLRLLAERDRSREEFRRAVQVGLDQLDRGEYTEYDDESLKDFFEQIKAEGRQSQSSPEGAP